MFQVVLALFMVQFTWAASRGSSNLEEEREALATLQQKFDKFAETVASADSKFSEIRAAAGQNSRAPRTDAITELVRSAAQQWRSIGKFYDQQRQEGLDLHRMGLERAVDVSVGLITYLAMRKNDRFGTGVPQELLLAMWRGLAEGTKSKEPPSRLRARGAIEGVDLSQDDSLLIMTTRGGLIRGRFQGMSGDQIVLEEILSGPFTRAQRKSGHFRTLALDNVARMEVIRKPESMSASSTRTIIDYDGFYAQYNVRQGLIFGIDYQPDDVEMVELIKERRTAEIRHRPRVAKINLELNDHPNYTHVFFADCGSLLSR